MTDVSGTSVDFHTSIAALRASEARYRTFVDHVSDGLFLHDPTGRVIDVNQQACKSLGYERDELIGMHPSDFDPDVTVEDVERNMRRMGGGELVAFDTHHRRKDGSVFPVEVRLRPLWIDGQLHGLALACDITRRKRAEAALRASETRYRCFVDHATDALFLHGPYGRVMDVNQQACESLGYERDELIGMFPSDFDPDVTPAQIEQFGARLHAGETVIFDSRHRRKDGSAFPVEVRTRAFWLDGERHAISLARDITERKRAEEKLRESEERFRALVNVSAQIYWTAGPDGKVVEDSPAWRAFTGQTYDQCCGDGWLDAIHPDDRQRVETRKRQCVSTQAPVDLEYRLWHDQSRDWRWVSDRAVCLRNPDGSTRAWVGMSADIHERKAADEVNARLAAIIASSDDAIVATTLDAIVTSWNGAAERLYGFTADEMVGQSIRRLIPQDRYDEADQILQRLRRGEAVEHFETVRVRKDGSAVSVSLTISPIRDGQGEIVGGSSIARDVTKQKRAEQALLDSQRFIARIASASPHLMYVFDRLQQRTVYSNRPVAADLGFAPEDVAAHGGQLSTQLLHPEDAQRLPAMLERWDAMRDDEVLETEYRLRDRDGNWHWFLGRDTVFTRNSDGTVEQIIGTAQDITNWKQAEEQLAVRQAELLHASRLTTVGRMVAALAHEVAQPLSAIGNFAAASEQVLDAEPDAHWDTLRQYLQAIVKQNQRCGAILQRLRDFSRRTVASRAYCDVRHLIRDSVELISNDLRRNGVALHCDLAEDLPPVLADPVQLQQVIVNLLTNAQDAVRDQQREHRVITIHALAETEFVVFDVEDLGTGLSDDVAARLFEPFFTTKENGMGIGLNICHSIVKDHGGQVEALRNQSQGAIFRVRLPIPSEDVHDGSTQYLRD